MFDLFISTSQEVNFFFYYLYYRVKEKQEKNIYSFEKAYTLCADLEPPKTLNTGEYRFECILGYVVQHLETEDVEQVRKLYAYTSPNKKDCWLTVEKNGDDPGYVDFGFILTEPILMESGKYVSSIFLATRSLITSVL